MLTLGYDVMAQLEVRDVARISTSLQPANFTDDGVDVNIRFGCKTSGELHAEPCADANNVDPDPGPRFEHCNLTLRAASEGQGVALAYGALVTEDLAAGTLVRLFDINLPSTVIYSLVCPKAYLTQPRVAAFRNWLTTVAKLDNVQAAAQSQLVSVKAVG